MANTKDTIYRYSGPLSGVTLEDREAMLHPGAEVPLPADNPYVKALVAKGLLTEVPDRADRPDKKKKEVTADAS